LSSFILLCGVRQKSPWGNSSKLTEKRFNGNQNPQAKK